MTQKTRMLVGLVAALVIAAAGGAYAYWGVFVAGEQEKAAEDADRRLLALEADAIERLEVRAKGETTVLEKNDGSWRLVQPVAAPADGAAVQSLLSSLTGARHLRTLAEADPAKFGLADPKVVVAAFGADGVRKEVALGARNAFDDSLFARDAAGRTVSASGVLEGSLAKSAFDLRDKRVVVVGEQTIQGIELQGGIALARDGEGWRLEAPVREPADRPTVDGIIRALQDLRATAFAAETVEDPKAFGLDAPAFRITLRRGEEAPITVAFGRADGKLYARADEGPVAEVRGDVLEKVEKGVDDLRDKQIFATFDSSTVRRIRFEGGDEPPFELEKRDDTWWIVQPEEKKAKQWKVSALISSVRGLRAERFEGTGARPADFGLDEPRTVALFDGEGKELARLHVGRQDGARAWVQAAGLPRIAEIQSVRLANLVPKRADVEEPPAEEAATAAAAGEQAE